MTAYVVIGSERYRKNIPAALWIGEKNDVDFKIVIPFPAGSTTDVIARSFSVPFSQTFGQPFIVEARVGGGGNVAAEVVSKSPPDGHTLLVATIGPLAVNASLYKNMPYDTLRDFAPISLAATQYMLLVEHPSLPIKTVKDLIAYAKAKPGQLNYGTQGLGTTSQLAAEVLKYMTKVNMTEVPYKGAQETNIDLISGRIQFAFTPSIPALGHVNAGKLNLLAISNNKRDPLLSDVATVSEAGVAGFDVRSWYGLVTRAGTPADIVDRLSAEMAKTLAHPDTKALYSKSGFTPVSTSPAEFSAYLKSEYAKWAEVIKNSGIKPE